MAKELNVELKFTTNNISKKSKRKKAKFYEDYNEGNITEKKEKNNKGTYEYRMSSTLVKELLKNRKGESKKLRANDFLCKIVNAEFGLKGTCVKVHQD